MTWRQHYGPQITEIIKLNEGKSTKELRRILYKMNPGQYNWMKKVWSDESLKQLGLKPRIRSQAIRPGENNLQIKLF